MSKKQPKEFRVEPLLMAAMEEFLEKGYEGASVDVIGCSDQVLLFWKEYLHNNQFYATIEKTIQFG